MLSNEFLAVVCVRIALSRMQAKKNNLVMPRNHHVILPHDSTLDRKIRPEILHQLIV